MSEYILSLLHYKFLKLFELSTFFKHVAAYLLLILHVQHNAICLKMLH